MPTETNEKRKKELHSGDFIRLTGNNNGLFAGAILSLTEKADVENAITGIYGRKVGTSNSFTVHGVRVYDPAMEEGNGMFSSLYNLGFHSTVNSNYVEILTRRESADALENLDKIMRGFIKSSKNLIDELLKYPNRESFLASKIIKAIDESLDKNGKVSVSDLAPVIKELDIV